MEIETGKLIHKSIITKLLKAVPKKYLKNVKKIKVTTVPDKEIKKQTRYWGGISASNDYKEKTIFIYLYAIAMFTTERFRWNNNWYHSAIESIASSLYFEVYILSTLGRGRRGGKVNNKANKFEKKLIKKAKKLNLLTVPKNIKKIRFLKIMRDKYINFVMKLMRNEKRFNMVFLRVIEHLRKVKMGYNYKYSISELYKAMFPIALITFEDRIIKQYKSLHLNTGAKASLIQSEQDRLCYNSIACFKRRIMKGMRGKCYISKKGRNYIYFTDKDLAMIKRQLKWRPKLPKLYRQRMLKVEVIRDEN